MDGAPRILTMAAEEAAPQPLASEASFPVKYQNFAGSEYNRDLKGSGMFSAVGGRTVFRFTGRGRNPFARGPRELDFAASDIKNVVATGRVVRFSTTLGRSGELKKPFIFFCRDADDSNAIVGLLPKDQDEDFVASREFYGNLQSLAGTDHPWLSSTNILIAANVAAFLVMAGFLGCGWFEVTDLRPYIRCGASNAAATGDGEWWRLVTSMFIHYGVLHLVLNMWALFQAGPLVERLLGKFPYVLTYLGAGIVGGLLSLVWNGDKIWSAGASGAIFGIYGALLGYMLREKKALPRAILQPLTKSTLVFVGYNLLNGFTHAGIDNAAHIGGLVSGTILGWILAMPLNRRSRAQLMGERLLWASMALAAMVGIGAHEAPRYPYVVKDELAWNDAAKDFVEKEPKLLLQERTELQRWEQKGDNAASLAPWIEKELAPLYADFAGKISALSLTPDRLTDQRRNKLVVYLRIKAEAFRHLDRAVRGHDYAEYDRYLKLESEATEVIKSLNALKR